jgi:hypothetical protein
MSHTLSQLYKVCRKWLNLITCKLDLNKALIKQLLKNARSSWEPPWGSILCSDNTATTQRTVCSRSSVISQDTVHQSCHSKVSYLSQLSPVFMLSLSATWCTRQHGNLHLYPAGHVALRLDLNTVKKRRRI